MSSENRTELRERPEQFWNHSQVEANVVNGVVTSVSITSPCGNIDHTDADLEKRIVEETKKIEEKMAILEEQSRIANVKWYEECRKIQAAVDADKEYVRLNTAFDKQYEKAKNIACQLIIYFRGEGIEFEPLTITDDVVRVAIESIKEYSEKQTELAAAKQTIAKRISDEFNLGE